MRLAKEYDCFSESQPKYSTDAPSSTAWLPYEGISARHPGNREFSYDFEAFAPPPVKEVHHVSLRFASSIAHCVNISLILIPIVVKRCVIRSFMRGYAAVSNATANQPMKNFDEGSKEKFTAARRNPIATTP